MTLSRYAIIICTVILMATGSAFSAPLRIIAFGDSLINGHGMDTDSSYAMQLQKALQAKGYDVRVQNAGISGNTSAQGLARMEQVLGGEPKPALVLVEFGANDMFRQIPVDTTEQNLRAILQTLKDRNIPAALFGIKNVYRPTIFFKSKFVRMYETLANDFDVPLYPFFLDGVVTDPKLMLPDGLHPNAAGVAVMVKNTLPLVEKRLQGK